MRHSPRRGTVDGMSRPTASSGAGHRRRWRWWHTALVVVCTPLLVFGLWAALLYVSLAGGLDDLFAGDPPTPDDPDVVAARDATSRALAADAARLTVAVVRPALGDDAAPAGRGEVRPPCAQGQHNWKIDDDYDLACDLSRIELVAVPGQDTFRTDMVALDAALRADGWVDHQAYGMGRVLTGYWDRRTEVGGPVSPAPGTIPSTPANTWPGGYSMNDLPRAQYRKAVDGQHRVLLVSWAETGSPATDVTYYSDDATFHGPDGAVTTAAALVAAVPADGYAVVLTESVEYFRD